MKRHNIFAITSGDPDGIGLEVTAKALAQLKSPRSTEFVVYASPFKSQRWLKMIKKTRNTTVILRDDGPAEWVRDAAKECLGGHFSGMITGPMSKNPTGHTEILSEVAQRPLGLMCFLGSKFHVVLATGHIPLSEVPANISEVCLQRVVREVLDLKKRLKLKKPIGLLGLNPHAGERGMIGKEDALIDAFVTKEARRDLIGPLVPDAAFTPDQIKKFGIFIALYHDQGLIPFKALHGFDEGAHVTLGLPFLRTSVDHGTAKDIFNRGRAKSGSMLSALNWARRLA